MAKNKRAVTLFAFGLFGLILFCRVFLGVFVIQPIGAVPDGMTVVYWWGGLNLPFVASADGILADSGAGVSIFGRAIVLAKFAEPIVDRKIFKFGYSETLYLWSTNGEKYDL